MEEGEDQQVEGEALRSDAVDGFGKAPFNLADTGFHAHAKMLNQEVLLRCVQPSAVGSPVSAPVYLLSFAPGILTGIVGVGGGVTIELPRQAVVRHDELHLDAMKIAPLAVWPERLRNWLGANGWLVP